MMKLIEENIRNLGYAEKAMKEAINVCVNAERELNFNLFQLVAKDCEPQGKNESGINYKRRITKKAFELADDAIYYRKGHIYDADFGELLQKHAIHWLYGECGGTLDIDKTDTRELATITEAIEAMIDAEGNGNVLEVAKALEESQMDVVVRELTGDIELFALATYIVRNNYKKRPLIKDSDFDEYEPSDFEKLREEAVKNGGGE